MDRGTSKIGVYHEHVLRQMVAQRKGQIGHRQRLTFARQRARDENGAEALVKTAPSSPLAPILDLLQRGCDLSILLHRRRSRLCADDQFGIERSARKCGRWPPDWPVCLNGDAISVIGQLGTKRKEWCCIGS